MQEQNGIKENYTPTLCLGLLVMNCLLGLPLETCCISGLRNCGAISELFILADGAGRQVPAAGCRPAGGGKIIVWLGSNASHTFLIFI